MRIKNYNGLFLLAFTFLSVAIFSQPTIQWQKSLGGTNIDGFNIIQQTADGGYIIGSTSRSNDIDVIGNNGKSDYWVVKLDANSNIQWQKPLGGTGVDNLKALIQTSDGGYIVGGNSYSDDGDVTGHHGTTVSADYWVVKLDSSGNIQWQKSLGGYEVEDFKMIKQTTDGGYIVGGNSLSSDGDISAHHVGSFFPNQDYWIVKLNSFGVIQWEKSLGGKYDEFFSNLQQTVDGGYIIGGTSLGNDGDVSGHHQGNSILIRTDYWIVKLDVNGIIQWQNCFGGTGDDYLIDILQTIDGGYIAGGSSNSNDGDVTGQHGIFSTGFYDYWVLKLDSAGSLQWQKTLGGTEDDQLKVIQQTWDGGYVVGGDSDSNNGDVTGHHGSTMEADYWFVKLDAGGNIQWQKSLGGSDWEEFIAAQQTSDGGFILGGNSGSNNGNVTGHHGLISDFDYWVIKLNTTGNIQWQKSLGGSGWEEFGTIQQTADGGFILGGFTESNDGDVSVNYGWNDNWILKLSSLTALENNASENYLAIYPNPTTSLINLNFTKYSKNRMVEVYNLLGEKIFVEQTNELQAKIDLQNYPSGVYFIKIIENNKPVYTQKIIKQ